MPAFFGEEQHRGSQCPTQESVILRLDAYSSSTSSSEGHGNPVGSDHGGTPDAEPDQLS